MKILVLMETRDVGGPARNMLESAVRLRDEVSFIWATYVRGGEADTPFIQAVEAAGFVMERMPERFRFDPGAAQHLKAFIRREQPDLIQVHNTKSRGFLQWSRAAEHRPVVSFFHGETWVDKKQKLYNLLDRRLFKKAQHIAVVADSQIELLAGWGVSRDCMRVIPNAIRPREAVFREPKRPFVFLSVGRLSREKGHHLLLEAVREVRRLGERDFKVHLVGDGPERAALEKQAAELDLSDTVAFEGYCPEPAAFYSKADLFLLPSLTEGFPNVLLEAASYGVPLAAFDVGGVSGILHHPSEALVLKAGDVAALAEVMQAFMHDPVPFQERAKAAKRRVDEGYSPERRADELLAYYRSLL